MPKRNIIKLYGSDEYYHIYNRGNDKNNIFLEDTDYYYFLSLFKRHLSGNIETFNKYRQFKNYSEEIELIAFCLMPNHYHLLCYLKDLNGLVHLTKSVMTAYTMYFNKKYKKTGKLCENTFLASRIDKDSYLLQISQYIHLNPVGICKDFLDYPYSSIQYFLGNKHADWLKCNRLLNSNSEIREYRLSIQNKKDNTAKNTSEYID